MRGTRNPVYVFNVPWVRIPPSPPRYNPKQLVCLGFFVFRLGLCPWSHQGPACLRCWVAVLENHQQADGSIRIPAALQPYLGGMAVLKAPGA